MSQIEGAGYPTQGEVVRFLYAAAGVLAEKRDQAPLGATERKALRKALQRLAAEEGELEENFGEMIKQLAFLVAGHLELARMVLAVGEVVSDLLDIYQQAIRDEGTFLNKDDTVRWLVRDRWVTAAALSIARNITRFGLRPLALYLPPAAGWYVPGLAHGKPLWPLQKVWRWIYEQTGLSQTEFHYKERNAEESDVERQRDLENAQNWLQGKHLPSAAALRWTVDRAFSARPGGEQGTSGMPRLPTPLHQEGVHVALFLARCSTHVSQELAERFGEDFLAQVCKLFERDLALALEETHGVDALISQLADQHNLSPLDPELRTDAINLWDDNLRARRRQAGTELDWLNQTGGLTGDTLDELVKAYGALPVLPLADWLQRPRGHEIPPGFQTALFEGLQLAEDRELTGQQIDEYDASLQASDARALLPWMVPWLRFLNCYRSHDDTAAWTWISDAYKQARYRAGSKQYKIVNQYIELAAKVGDRVAFRKGVNWARYVGIDVRWLRDKDPTPENIDFAMEVFRRSRYSV